MSEAAMSPIDRDSEAAGGIDRRQFLKSAGK